MARSRSRSPPADADFDRATDGSDFEMFDLSDAEIISDGGDEAQPIGTTGSMTDFGTTPMPTVGSMTSSGTTGSMTDSGTASMPRTCSMTCKAEIKENDIVPDVKAKTEITEKDIGTTGSMTDSDATSVPTQGSIISCDD